MTDDPFEFYHLAGFQYLAVNDRAPGGVPDGTYICCGGPTETFQWATFTVNGGVIGEPIMSVTSPW